MKVNPEISAIAVIVFSTAMAQITHKENTRKQWALVSEVFFIVGPVN